MISRFFVLFVSAYATSAAVIPSSTSTELLDDRDTYSLKPSEILPIQPILIYPLTNEMPPQGRGLFKDDKIIYIKLLNPTITRPKKVKNKIDENHVEIKEIFYVTALANGQFSTNRLKAYRSPEFYTITVYKMGQLKE